MKGELQQSIHQGLNEMGAQRSGREDRSEERLIRAEL